MEERHSLSCPSRVIFSSFFSRVGDLTHLFLSWYIPSSVSPLKRKRPLNRRPCHGNHDTFMEWWSLRARIPWIFDTWLHHLREGLLRSRCLVRFWQGLWFHPLSRNSKLHYNLLKFPPRGAFSLRNSDCPVCKISHLASFFSVHVTIYALAYMPFYRKYCLFWYQWIFWKVPFWSVS